MLIHMGMAAVESILRDTFYIIQHDTAYRKYAFHNLRSFDMLVNTDALQGQYSS